MFTGNRRSSHFFRRALQNLFALVYFRQKRKINRPSPPVTLAEKKKTIRYALSKLQLTSRGRRNSGKIYNIISESNHARAIQLHRIRRDISPKAITDVDIRLLVRENFSPYTPPYKRAIDASVVNRSLFQSYVYYQSFQLNKKQFQRTQSCILL